MKDAIHLFWGNRAQETYTYTEKLMNGKTHFFFGSRHGKVRSMTDENEMISVKDATKEVQIATRRIALLHLSYARILMDELGESKGKELIVKAIKDYGIRIGERKKKGEQTAPKFGFHERTEQTKVDGEERTRAYGCTLAKVWTEYGEKDLGRLYCYVDPAQSMGANSMHKVVHTRAIPVGDEYCELTSKPTTSKERKDLLDKKVDWQYIDEYLIGKKPSSRNITKS